MNQNEKIRMAARLAMPMAGPAVGAPPQPAPPPAPAASGADNALAAAPFAPVEGDYIRSKFRALSRAVFTAGARPAGFDYEIPVCLDFGTPGVLEAAVGMIVGQPVYRDHNQSVDNWCGVIESDEWSDGDGDLPPGINVTLKIDAVAEPKIARGLLSTPPAIKAGSVQVDFDFTASHQFSDPNEFWRQQGQAINGQTVRCVITAIYGFGEYSLVWKGADPFAVHLSKPTSDVTRPASDSNAPATATNQGGLSMKLTTELAARTRAVLGADTPADLDTSETGAELGLSASLTKLEAMKSELRGALEQVTNLKPGAQAGADLVAELRKEVTCSAKLVRLGSAEGELDALTTKSIAGASVAELQVMRTELAAEADKKVPLVCPQCKVALTRRSSQPGPADDGTTPPTPFLGDPVAATIASRYAK